MNGREAAYHALLGAMRDTQRISDSLAVWEQQHHPAAVDFHFAYEVAVGSCRQLLALDYLAHQCSKTKLSLKRKERALLYTALYQHFYMDAVPLYAITNESVTIAKRCCRAFAPFLNHYLRRLPSVPPPFPEGNSADAWSIRYSYPRDYIKKLLTNHTLEVAQGILEATNTVAPIMARQRTPPFTIKHLKGADAVKAAAADSTLYIQNITPITLMQELAAQSSHTPTTLLDLCASPGGKLLLAHDLFPAARLFANDISAAKIARLNANLTKYGISATTTIQRGEDYRTSIPFDLIIIDAPCSNSGVYHKRPEARWRPDALTELQYTLLTHAYTLLAPKGQIWYLTCSILDEENDAICSRFIAHHPLNITYSKTILPNIDGHDGGYGCCLA